MFKTLSKEEKLKQSKGVGNKRYGAYDRNARLQVVTKFFTKLADTFSDAKTILPWLLSSLSAPAFFVGLLVPVRESGSLIPQVYFAGFIKKSRLRKWFFVFGSLGQALAVVMMMALAIFSWGGLQSPESQALSGFIAGLSVILCLVVFSLARCVCSIASKDVLGKTVPSTKRGRVNGWGASVAGLVTLGLGFCLVFNDHISTLFQFLPKANVLLGILLLASLCWVLAAVAFSLVLEKPGEKEEGAAVDQLKTSVQLLKQDKRFRDFLLTRLFLMSSGLAAPFLVLLANTNSEVQAKNIGLFVIVNGLASIVSANFWGRMADKSSRKVLVLTASLTACLCMIAAFLSFVVARGEGLGVPGDEKLAWVAIALFFMLACVHQGVRLGRKTYIVNAADGNKRTEYVAVGNSLIGVCLLAVGLISALLSQLSTGLVFFCFALSALLALLFAIKLKELSGAGESG